MSSDGKVVLIPEDNDWLKATVYRFTGLFMNHNISYDLYVHLTSIVTNAKNSTHARSMLKRAQMTRDEAKLLNFT